MSPSSRSTRRHRSRRASSRRRRGSTAQILHLRNTRSTNRSTGRGKLRGGGDGTRRLPNPKKSHASSTPMSAATKVGLGLGAAAVAALGTRSYLERQRQNRVAAIARAQADVLQAEPRIQKLISAIEKFDVAFTDLDRSRNSIQINQMKDFRNQINAKVIQLAEATVGNTPTTQMTAELQTLLTRCEAFLKQAITQVPRESAVFSSFDTIIRDFGVINQLGYSILYNGRVLLSIIATLQSAETSWLQKIQGVTQTGYVVSTLRNAVTVLSARVGAVKANLIGGRGD